MELFLTEHGQTIQYAVIGIMIVAILNAVCISRWVDISPVYKTDTSNTNSEFINDIQGKKPIIEADEIIYTDYRDESFNIRDWISAKDYSGKDLTSQIKIYGVVDVATKGIYKLRCIVVADNNLSCTKYINVIVE